MDILRTAVNCDCDLKQLSGILIVLLQALPYLMVEHGSIGCSLSRREEEWDRTQNSKNKLRSLAMDFASAIVFHLVMSLSNPYRSSPLVMVNVS